MAQGILYTVDGDGNLHAMRPSAPASEDEMQALVARHPDLITDGDGALLLIRREQPIADSVEGTGRWSLDHLFVTRDGVPVLVELKRAVDTRLRREVVGQILDYAANATAYWKAGEIAIAFASTHGSEAEQNLAKFLDGADADSFWSKVDSNFRAGQIKLVFVADSIPSELARIVEFLNEQMRADVRAVELRWFVSDHGMKTLSPRIIGETERAKASKAAQAGQPVLSPDAWIAEYLSPFGIDVAAAANTYIRIILEEGGDVGVPSTRGSIYAVFRDKNDAHVYPFNLWQNKAQLSLSLAYLKNRPAFASEETRKALLDRAQAIFGTLSTTNIGGFPGAAVTKLNNPEVATAFREFFRDIKAIGTR